MTTTETPGERRLLTIWRWARGAIVNWLGTVLLTSGATLLAFGTDHVGIFRAGLGVTAVGLVSQLATSSRHQKLITKERTSRSRAIQRSASLQSILESGVRVLMEELAVDFHDARASIYRHKDDHFILLARMSDSPILEERGRGRYPDSEGLIGTAWAKGEGVVVDLPDDRSEWEQTCVDDYGMAPKDVAKLSMQSKSLLGKRFDASTTPKSHVGLIVIESTRKRGVKGSTLDAVRDSPVYAVLERVLIEAVSCLDEQDVDDFNEAR